MEWWLHDYGGMISLKQDIRVIFYDGNLGWHTAQLSMGAQGKWGQAAIAWRCGALTSVLWFLLAQYSHLEQIIYIMPDMFCWCLCYFCNMVETFWIWIHNIFWELVTRWQMVSETCCGYGWYRCENNMLLEQNKMVGDINLQIKSVLKDREFCCLVLLILSSMKWLCKISIRNR